MLPRPQVAQAELTQSNRDLFRTGGSLFLDSYKTGCSVLPAKLIALKTMMKDLLQLHNFKFWRQLVKVDVGKTVLVTPAICKSKNVLINPKVKTC
jgi:hypothetical protein